MAVGNEAGRRSALALKAKGLRRQCDCDDLHCICSALALKAKGLRPSSRRRRRSTSPFSTGPESKGIETPCQTVLVLCPLFSTGPESKGIETGAQGRCRHHRRCSALALKAKGLRPRVLNTRGPGSGSALALKAKGLRQRLAASRSRA